MLEELQEISKLATFISMAISGEIENSVSNFAKVEGSKKIKSKVGQTPKNHRILCGKNVKRRKKRV